IVGIIYIGIFIGSSIFFFKKNSRYIAFGMFIPNLIQQFIVILMSIHQFIINRTPGINVVKYSNIYLIILGSLSLFLAFSFLLIMNILKSRDHLGGEKMSNEENESVNRESDQTKNKKKVFDFFKGLLFPFVLLIFLNIIWILIYLSIWGTYI
ncbi:MAG: hypothetical protein ACTSQ5_14545, partial [Promethearchaeota archaeon]